MENVNANGARGATQEVGDSQEKQDEPVSYETYRKIVSEKKKAMAELVELRDQKLKFEQEKLELEGKKDEALALWKKKADAFESELKATKQKFQWNSIESQIKNVAMESGCSNVNAFMKLLDKETLKTVEVDENFNVDKQGILKLIDESKKEFADLNLFSKAKIQVHDVTAVNKNKAPSVDDLVAKCKTPEEVAKLLRTLN